jgi:hypothetical protein
VQDTRVLQVGQYIIIADRMDQAGALRPDVTLTISDYGDDQVNQKQTMGAGHKGVASGTIYHNGRQDGSSRCTMTNCNNYSRSIFEPAGSVEKITQFFGNFYPM